MVAVSSNYRKHTEANPAHRFFLERFHRRLVELVRGVFPPKATLGPLRVLDVGCGEGFVLARLAPDLHPAQVVGLDRSAEALIGAGRLCPGVHLGRAEAAALPLRSASFDLVLCLEVLEHLSQPEAALAELCRVSRGHIILSVPHQPYFSLANLLRGRHLRTWGDAPEHRHRWGKARFLELVSRQGRPLKVVSSFPWILVLSASGGQVGRKP